MLIASILSVIRAHSYLRVLSQRAVHRMVWLCVRQLLKKQQSLSKVQTAFPNYLSCISYEMILEAAVLLPCLHLDCQIMPPGRCLKGRACRNVW